MKASTLLRLELKTLLFVGILIGILFPLTLKLGLLSVNTWHIPFYLLLLVEVFSIKKSKFNRVGSWELSLISLVFIYIISTSINDNAEKNVEMLFGFVNSCFLGIYVSLKWGHLINEKMFLRFLVITILIQTFFGLIQQYTGSTVGNLGAMIGTETKSELGGSLQEEYSVSRVGGTLGHPNYCGTFILVAFSFLLMIWNRTQNSTKWFIIFGVLMFAGVTIMFTISRAIIAGLAVLILLVYGMKFVNKLKFRKYPRKRVVFVTILSMVVSVLLYIRFTQIINLGIEIAKIRIEDTLNDDGGASSLDHRLRMNEGALVRFGENPIIGIGFGNMRWQWDDLDIHMPHYATDMWPHNIYVLLLSESGIVGTAIFIYGLFYLIRKLWLKQKTDDDAFARSLLAIILTFLLLFTVYQSPFHYKVSPLFFLILGVSSGYIKDKNRLM